MPRQHPGSGNSIEMLVQRNKCGCAKRARVAWFTANVQGTIRTRCKHRVHLIQHMHSVHGRRLRVIPLKRAFLERVEFVVEEVEVDVLGMVVVEVVAHGDGSGSSRTRSFQIGT